MLAKISLFLETAGLTCRKPAMRGGSPEMEWIMVKDTRGLLQESWMRGSVDFPFQMYDMRTEGELITVPCHWHEEVEIVRMEAGGLAVRVDEEEALLYPGDVAFVNAGQLHQMKAVSRDTRYHAYVFPLMALLFEREDLAQINLLRPLLENRLGFPLLLSGEGVLASQVRRRMDDIIAWDQSRPVGYEILIKAGLLEIICILAGQNCLVEYHTRRESDVCKDILLYIQEHYREKIAVPEVARAVGISENYFSSFFGRHLNKNFVDYLTEYRINQSVILLEATDHSVTDIALECGFSTPSYYIQSFKRLKRMTPLQYRRKGGHYR